MENKRVLMLATSHKTRGGVTAVVNAYTKCDFWKAHQVDWLETHIDKSKGMKLCRSGLCPLSNDCIPLRYYSYSYE